MPDNHEHPKAADATERMPVDRPTPSRPESDAEKTTRISAVTDEATERTRPATGTRTQVVPESDNERTQNLTAVPSDFPDFSASQTQSIPVWSETPHNQPPTTPPVPPPHAAASGDGGADKRRGLMRAGIAAGAVVGALALLYVGDLVFSSGKVPRGTVVADVAIGGLDKASAETELRERLGPGLGEPVELRAGDQTATIDPAAAGLEMDWAETVEQAGTQPLNPFTRVSSLFTTREVHPVSHGDRTQLTQALEQVKPQLDRAPAEGNITFEGAKPVASDPVTGRQVDLQGATDAVLAGWAEPDPVAVPFTEQPVTTTREGVQRALNEVAKPAVSAPVTVRGQGKDATFAPEAIAKSLRFEPDGNGGLKPMVDMRAAVAGVEPQLASTIVPGKDAQIVLEGGAPVVKPSTDGIGIDWNKSFERLPEILRQPGNRSVQALYVHQPARFTTDQANQLGVREVVGEFSTSGFEPASGVNIRRTAEQVNGALVKPGETFSLNGHTGPRGAAQGYVESGIIQDGRPGKAVGGGISQFATTIYNASYFAGMQDVEHKAHSYYISRYPAGREATVFQSPDGSSVIDVKFKNTSKSGIMITTQWTPSSITVKFWGTKQWDVTSQTGERTSPTPPHEVVVPPGQPCSPSKGTGGFTVTDTRTLRDVHTGEVRTERPKKTVYEPQPIVHCGPPPPGAAAAPPPR
ncbi:VanW family protein [Saccharopolyspora erythraea]|uniref:VanW family protein n=1 Tax=Saccharopolyspora erythraea TaxID=1836 RepID=UPI001BAAFB16|nr:VanW family protein [Saccharopolyspora erythraea]QUH05603.1 VanW family protein [Saccharopolyspora erythraea]